MSSALITMLAIASYRRDAVLVLDGNTPIGVAARNIRKGETISYDPQENTNDVLVKAKGKLGEKNE